MTELESVVREKLKNVIDPEVNINIVDLGLVYRVSVVNEFAEVDITLTSPTCPLLNDIEKLVKNELRKIKQLKGHKLRIVWEPLWTVDRMSDEAKLQLGVSGVIGGYK